MGDYILSLSIIQHYKFPINSNIFHEERKKIVPSGIYEGFIVKASEINLGVDISEGKAVMPSGACIYNDEPLRNILSISPNNTGDPRIDVICLHYDHGRDPNVNVPKFKIIEGEVGGEKPIIDKEELEIAVIEIPPASQSINNSMIKNIPPLPKIDDRNIVFYDIIYDQGNDEFLVKDFSIKYEHLDNGLTFNGDIKSKFGKIPYSMAIANTKMALEGMFWGNFSLEHVYNNAVLEKSIVTIKEGEPPYDSVEVLYTYDVNNRIIKQEFNDGYINLVLNYTYDSNFPNRLPNVEQVVVYV